MFISCTIVFQSMFSFIIQICINKINCNLFLKIILYNVFSFFFSFVFKIKIDMLNEIYNEMWIRNTRNKTCRINRSDTWKFRISWRKVNANDKKFLFLKSSGENVFSSILIFFRRTHRSLRHLPWGSLGGKRGNGCSETEMQQKCNNVIMLATK